MHRDRVNVLVAEEMHRGKTVRRDRRVCDCVNYKFLPSKHLVFQWLAFNPSCCGLIVCQLPFTYRDRKDPARRITYYPDFIRNHSFYKTSIRQVEHANCGRYHLA